DYLERLTQIVSKPFLAGDRTCVTLSLVLVIIHQDQTVGIGGQLFVVVIVVRDWNIHEQLHAMTVQIGPKFSHQRIESRLSGDWNFLEVQRDSPIPVCPKKGENLPAEIGSALCTIEKASHRGQPFLSDGIEVVDERENLDVGPFPFDQSHQLFIYYTY